MKNCLSRDPARRLRCCSRSAAPRSAEANQVRFARQLGLGYLQFYVMQEQAAGRGAGASAPASAR